MARRSEVEARLVAAAVAGDVLDLSTDDRDLDDPTNADDWDDARRIRGEVVAELCAGDLGQVHARGVRIRGAEIVGDIDLTDLNIPHSLWLVACRISHGILTAEAATIRSLHLPGTHVATTDIDHAVALNLDDTRIGHLLNLGDRYWTPDGSEVAVGPFTAHGEVRLLWSIIGQQLAMNGAKLTAGDSGYALNAQGATIQGGTFLCDEFTAQGEVRLVGATIGGTLVMSGAQLTAGDSGNALTADRVTIRGDGHLQDGFIAQGEVRLVDATIGGRLVMSGAQLTAGDSGYALNTEGVAIDSDAFLHGGFTAHGEIRMLNSTIGGSLDMSGAQLTAGASGDALTADGVTIDREAFLNHGFTAHGEVRMLVPTIGGQLAMSGAQLTAGDSGKALNTQGATIDRGAYLVDGFTANGDVLLFAAELPFLVVAGDVQGVVDLRQTTAGSAWFGDVGTGGEFRLEGFRYTAIDPTHHGEPDVEKHLAWVKLDPGYAPGKFDQLAAAYTRAGHDQQADQVIVAKQRARRETLPGWRQSLDRLLDITVAYGTQPWRAGAMLIGWIVLIAWPIYTLADTTMSATSTPAPTLRPLLYAADVTIPVLDFGHRRWWHPATTWMAIFTATSVAVGWLLSTVTVIGFTGILGRRD